MLQYAITDRTLYPGTETDRQAALLRQAQRLATGGVDFLQIREKDLDTASLLTLAMQLQAAVHPQMAARSQSAVHFQTPAHPQIPAQPQAPAEIPALRLLLNGPPSLATQAGLHGIHLTFSALASLQVPPLRSGGPLFVSASIHTAQQAAQAAGKADLLLFAPVFHKQVAGTQVQAGVGLAALQAACRAAGNLPVLALGGVTFSNAPLCLQAGAAGIAGIRLFQELPS